MRILLSAVLALAPAHAAWSEINVAVVAPQGPEAAIDAWQPLADRLSAELGDTVNLYPFGPVEGTDAFFEGFIDVFIGNPVQTAVIVDTMGAAPIASIERANGTEFAGLIVVRSDGPIETLQDLAGARIATLGDWAAGGFVFQAHHLKEAGLGRPGEIGDRLRASNQNELVQMVLEGNADAAFIRTGVLEDRIAKGVIESDTLRVLDARPSDEAQVQRTTKWFPSWFVSVSSALDAAVVSRLNDTLMAVTPEMPEAQSARIRGFSPPLDVAPVVQAMRLVGVPPYD